MFYNTFNFQILSFIKKIKVIIINGQQNKFASGGRMDVTDLTITLASTHFIDVIFSDYKMYMI